MEKSEKINLVALSRKIENNLLARYTDKTLCNQYAWWMLENVPVVGDIPSNPSPYNNQLMQVTTGFKDIFVPVLNSSDASIFALSLKDNALAPTFVKGDCLIISPEVWTRSGDVAAVEYGNDTVTKAIMQVTYTEDFIVLEAVNHKQAPIALVRGKDHFRIIGRVISRHQKLA